MRTNLSAPENATSVVEHETHGEDRKKRVYTKKAKTRWVRQPQPTSPILSFNEEHQGYELRLPAPPNEELKSKMKADGWRYIFKGQHVWYKKGSDEATKTSGEKIIADYVAIPPDHKVSPKPNVEPVETVSSIPSSGKQCAAQVNAINLHIGLGTFEGII